MRDSNTIILWEGVVQNKRERDLYKEHWERTVQKLRDNYTD